MRITTDSATGEVTVEFSDLDELRLHADTLRRMVDRVKLSYTFRQSNFYPTPDELREVARPA